ncbi:MAG: DMT family transporter [Bacteroidetes bacterium]|nr:DMT family transporter [Bacteroidota bacterium]
MNSKFLNWSILFLLALVWGSSFILMKRGLDVFTSSQVAGLRMFIAFLFIIPFAFRYVKVKEKKDWLKFLGIGLFGNFIPAFLFTAAETGISSSLTGMLNGLTPFFTLLIGILVFKSKVSANKIIGIFIGLVGAVGLLIPEKFSDLGTNINYGGYVIIATILYGMSVNFIRQYAGNYHSITTTCWAILLVGPFGGAYLLFTDFSSAIHHPLFWSSLGYVALLAIGGTALSVMLFNLLVKNTGTLFSSSVTYLIPIVAILWGFFDGEEISLRQILSIFVILGGVYLVNRK